jgi:hypothetical protein
VSSDWFGVHYTWWLLQAVLHPFKFFRAFPDAMFWLGTSTQADEPAGNPNETK